MIAVLVTYFAILIGIGWWASRESRSVAGFYVAGKKLPSWVIAFSSNTTGESGWLLLGLTGMGYLVGFHALWVVLGEVIGVALAWAVVARPFKEFTDRYDAITVPDYLADRFADRAHVLRLVSAVIIFTMVGAYTAAQLTASGKAFSSFLGTSYEGGVLLGAAVILLYTSIGGFKAVAYSDVVQGVLMFLCLLLLPIFGIWQAGGWGELMAGIGAIDPALLLPMGEHGWSAAGVISALSFAGIGLAFLGAPQLLTRFMSARNRGQIGEGGVIAVLCIVVFDIGAVLTGVAGRYLFPGLADPETVLPVMSTEFFPALIAGVILVVVLAAIMSTVDSLLILASSAVVRDTVQKVFRPDFSDRRLALIGRGLTVVIGLGGLAVALPESRMIFWFVLFAWSGLASAFTPVVLCSLFWRGTTRAGAVSGMIAGFLTAVVWVLPILPGSEGAGIALKAHFHDLYEMIPGFAVGFLVTIAVSRFTKPPPDAGSVMDDVKRVVGGPFTAAAVGGRGAAMPTGGRND